ncbi:hypothetical protein Tco_1029375 [Tanacetum coccineum]|uniref:Uncharacterized protein n=1 Tax=Tanacetum coccineum TaxID=301880 RepID=A0ABQ5G392_9ASTR
MVDDVSLVDGVFEGAFGGDEDEDYCNASRAKKLEKSLMIIWSSSTHGSSSRNLYYYVDNPPAVVDFDEGELFPARVRVIRSIFMEQMLLAKQDEAGGILTDEQNDFLFADASRMEEIEELSANICLLAKLTKQLARNAYAEAAKQQRFAHRKMSENEDKYHDTILDLEEKLKKNVDLFLKIESFVEQTCSSSSYIPFVKILETKSMPSELPLINELFNIKVGFEKLFLLIKQNSKRASMFYTSTEEIALNNFCRDQVKPLLNELLDYFDGFQNLFQRDIKEMKDAFEQNDVYLDEIERQNDLLKDQLLEASLKHDIELECV